MTRDERNTRSAHTPSSAAARVVAPGVAAARIIAPSSAAARVFAPRLVATLVVGVVASSVVVGSACSGRVGGHSHDEVGTATISIRGSDTMLNLAQRWAERFMDESPGVAVEVSGGGTGTGIAALVNGTVDIACASRPITARERNALRSERGSEARETHVALDAVAVYVHADNPVRSLTLEQLSRIYRGQIVSWAELGGRDLPIVLYGRENSSGTYAFFKESVLEQLDFAAETQSLPGTAAVIHAVSHDVKGIGYGGIGYAAGVAHLALAGRRGEAPIGPSLAAARSGRYPLTRRLSMITTARSPASVQRFLDWVRSPDGQRVVESIGFYPLDAPTASLTHGASR